MPRRANTAEHRRLAERNRGDADWDLWGPYLSYRAWGTVREDYSADGSAWDHFPHDQARSRAYRWNEDGLAAISDRNQYLCFGIALWNGEDPILKERLFGLSGKEGNHAEDVKEVYAHRDATPTSSYLEFLYRYPQRAYPYAELVEGNARRTVYEPEYDLEDTDAFDDGYFDTRVRYAKAAVDDIRIEIEVTNVGDHAASCLVMPTLWFRNTWSWGYPNGPMGDVPSRPVLSLAEDSASTVVASHPVLGDYHLDAPGSGRIIFTENETNVKRIWGGTNASPYVKDAFHRFVIEAETDAVNPDATGTKAAAFYPVDLDPGQSTTISLRLCSATAGEDGPSPAEVVTQRRSEADEFYVAIGRDGASGDAAAIQRAAYAGLLWSKQLYYFDVEQWLNGDPAGIQPPTSRRNGRNRDWLHLNNFDIVSMPDVWEYPWYAAWDLAFHCVPLAKLDPEFAKEQMELLTREWYMHPSGQLPAYEWELGDVNPPVHAWGARRVYEIDAAISGEPDTAFLKRVFHKLLLNFTWWVNRKDVDGNNVFEGGFLGLDNVSVFNRSEPLPGGGELDQSDGTAWVAFFTLEMLAISLELAKTDEVYQDLATKFFEHFLAIATAMSAEDHCLWNPDDGFFYDVLRLPDGASIPLELRSMVGLIPLLAVTILDQETIDEMPEFGRRMQWFLERRPHLSGNVASIDAIGRDSTHIASVLTPERLRSVLGYMLDEGEFLSPHGIRSLSKFHERNPFELNVAGHHARVGYEPGESRSSLFGGNSNWRGPVWLPLNYLLIEALEQFHEFYGPDFRVEFPSGSGDEHDLHGVAAKLRERLVSLFTIDDSEARAFWGGESKQVIEDLLYFHEYFDGDTGQGLGAIHQTGWTGLVATLIDELE